MDRSSSLKEKKKDCRVHVEIAMPLCREDLLKRLFTTYGKQIKYKISIIYHVYAVHNEDPLFTLKLFIFTTQNICFLH
jgi:hypothetical protein